MLMTEILDLKMAENEKTYEQQQREYLWEILKAGLTIISDEDEGHGQVVNYPNVCAVGRIFSRVQPFANSKFQPSTVAPRYCAIRI